MNDRFKNHAAPTRDGPNTGQTGTRTGLDAVGHVVAVGDTVTTLRGSSVTPAVVQRMAGDRLVVQRADGMVAVLNHTSVVVLRPVDRSAKPAAS